MKQTMEGQVETGTLSGGICHICGAKDGEAETDGSTVRVQEWEGELVCAECKELLMRIRRWV
jgi:hypothetical protein